MVESGMTNLQKVPLKEVIWVESQVLKEHDNPPPESQWRYKLVLPSFLAEWDVFADWEKEHFLSMEKNLKQGDILFDIGTEAGWCNIIYARFCGPENIILIEPNRDFWPNIKAIWEKNYPGKLPKGCYHGLFSNRTTDKRTVITTQWPGNISNNLMVGLAYKYIHEHGHLIPQIKLDDYVKSTGIIPNALTIDVEGAELLVLQGAENTLKNNTLKVWVSIHPELGEKDYKVGSQQVHDFMLDCGYKSKFLAAPNEEHWYYEKL